jgi:Peptidase A4 family
VSAGVGTITRWTRPGRGLRALVKVTALAAGLVALGGSTALADSQTSSNWAGYVAHRSGVRFRSVTAQWRVPTASCTTGLPTYSAMWVGLGGYSQSSNSLEQTGTEADCSSSGQPRYSAWYELVPAASQTISLGVRAGDLIRAKVSAAGHRVTVVLEDLSDHGTFSRTFYPSQMDIDSAEWVVEAPSDCSYTAICRTLPLANFGRAAFSAAGATSMTGRTGTIADPGWGTTAITLLPQAGGRFIADTSSTSSGEAIPSSLSAGESAFAVRYQQIAHVTPGSGGPYFSRLPSGALVHPHAQQ